MKFVKRIIFFISLFLFYIIFRELVELYQFARSIDPAAGYFTLAFLAIIIFYLVIIPLYKIIRIPRSYGPAKDKAEIPGLIQKRMEAFKDNPYLTGIGYNFTNISYDETSYQNVNLLLEKECETIRKKYVSRVFYGTSISQNGFLDAVIILSASVNIVKDIFILYNGRVSNRDLWTIAKKVYYSVAIGGSEGVEYAVEEIFSKLGTESMKSIPFADKVLGSLADGFVNAALLTRISLITENYCKLLYIEKDRDLFPNPKFVLTSTKMITSNIFDNIKSAIKKAGAEKAESLSKYFANPVAYLVSKFKEINSFDTSGDNAMGEYVISEGNSVGYGLTKLFQAFRR